MKVQIKIIALGIIVLITSGMQGKCYSDDTDCVTVYNYTTHPVKGKLTFVKQKASDDPYTPTTYSNEYNTLSFDISGNGMWKGSWGGSVTKIEVMLTKDDGTKITLLYSLHESNPVWFEVRQDASSQCYLTYSKEPDSKTLKRFGMDTNERWIVDKEQLIRE
jgi:hypothetical protein